MKKLLIAATLTAVALGATPLLAQQAGDKKPAATAATDGCPMTGGHGNRTERHAEMQARMQAMHANMGSHEGRDRGTQGEHQH